MPCYVISYDLKHKDEEDYKTLINSIKAFRKWAHINESTWAIVTHKEAKEIRDHLRQFIHNDDSIFVIKSGVEAAWRNVIASNIWLKNHL